MRAAARAAWRSPLARSASRAAAPVLADAPLLLSLHSAPRLVPRSVSSVLPLPTVWHGRQLWTSATTSSKQSATDTIAPVGGKASAPGAIAKAGRVSVLRFDERGDGELLEMSRSTVLQLTQEAAVPVENDTDDALGSDRSTSSGSDLGKYARRDSAGRRSETRDGPAVELQLVHARDVRKLDNTFSVFNEPSIEIRNQAILVSADPLRAILMRDTCLVFVHDQANSAMSMLQHNFNEMTHLDVAVPFEFKALEAILATLSYHFKDIYERTAPDIAATLDRLAHGQVNVSELEKLREFKNTINGFESQVDHVSRALLKLLDNEEDLRLLYLTKLHHNPSLLQNLWLYDSEEAEVLIESYLQDIVSTRIKTSLLQRQIVNTESLVMLKLDSMRNYLLGVELVFSLAVISLATGTFVTGMFGMNLPSGLEGAQGVFWGVAGATAVSMSAATALGVAFFKRKGILWKF